MLESEGDRVSSSFVFCFFFALSLFVCMLKPHVTSREGTASTHFLVFVVKGRRSAAGLLGLADSDRGVQAPMAFAAQQEYRHASVSASPFLKLELC